MTDPIQLARECGFDPLTPDSSFYTAGEYQIALLISRVREEAIRECAEVCDPFNVNDPDDWTEYARTRAECGSAIRALLDQSGAGDGPR